MQRDDRLRNRAELGILTEHIYYINGQTRLLYSARLRARVKIEKCKRAGLYSRVAHHKPLLSDRHKRLCRIG